MSIKTAIRKFPAIAVCGPFGAAEETKDAYVFVMS